MKRICLKPKSKIRFWEVTTKPKLGKETRKLSTTDWKHAWVIALFASAKNPVTEVKMNAAAVEILRFSLELYSKFYSNFRDIKISGSLRCSSWLGFNFWCFCNFPMGASERKRRVRGGHRLWVWGCGHTVWKTCYESWSPTDKWKRRWLERGTKRSAYSPTMTSETTLASQPCKWTTNASLCLQTYHIWKFLQQWLWIGGWRQVAAHHLCPHLSLASLSPHGSG